MTVNRTLIEAQDERIERYLRRQMNSEETMLFEQDLRLDESLRGRARFIGKLLKTMMAQQEGLVSAADISMHRMVAGNPLKKHDPLKEKK